MILISNNLLDLIVYFYFSSYILMRILSGFRSLCAIPLEWMNSTALANSLIMFFYNVTDICFRYKTFSKEG